MAGVELGGLCVKKGKEPGVKVAEKVELDGVGGGEGMEGVNEGDVVVGVCWAGTVRRRAPHRTRNMWST